jgi:hypothetical protein
MEGSRKLGRTEIKWDTYLLAYADDVNLLGDNINVINENTGTVIDASKEVGVEVNAKNTKYMLMPHHQKVGQNHNIKIGNRFF